MQSRHLHVKRNKSPGPDQLPNEFYKLYAYLIAGDLTDVFGEAHRTGELPPKMKEGTITLLYKKNSLM